MEGYKVDEPQENPDKNQLRISIHTQEIQEFRE